ncbi:hypothetical protein MFLO_15885 [Listeria floridensis FSL S10-1187]|uniref:Phage protein n=1 Tax=Listeria floridensis FSL S10-1187 TaxID=1265817 RepID=A0ABP3ATH4_9LIST|nr:hypothetical protein [Listeria floridensis]EUJ23495.1 hypothetical protein MFLO_15885 [Listeria floridensis FSL S10-1187]
MKLVLNKCYGGFGLSHIAMMNLFGLKDIEVYPYKKTDINGGIMFLEIDISYNDSPQDGSSIWYLKKPLRKLEWQLIENWDEIEQIGFDFLDNDKGRADEDLIKVVEMLGAAANSRYSKLKIVEIPDGSEVVISDYDGFEQVIYGKELGRA